MTPATRLFFTVSGAIVAAGGVLLLLVAMFLPARDTASAMAVDGTSFALPDPGLLGGSVTVYGSQAVEDHHVLGCRLLSSSGSEQSRARMSALGALSEEPVVLDGVRLVPIFTVSQVSTGERLECAQPEAAGEMAVGAASTFGGLTDGVRLLALTLGVLALGLGLASIIAARLLGRPRSGVTSLR
ncbi:MULTISPECIES: hypothetical protein [unclassified Janibacter]|uniref:hypothetical protein n=1 Tax=unclassified Janibacter TaxID=2649294 RepID=UPI003CFBDD2F